MTSLSLQRLDCLINLLTEENISKAILQSAGQANGRMRAPVELGAPNPPRKRKINYPKEAVAAA
jgi:hypothetical protein